MVLAYFLSDPDNCLRGFNSGKIGKDLSQVTMISASKLIFDDYEVLFWFASDSRNNVCSKVTHLLFNAVNFET